MYIVSDLKKILKNRITIILFVVLLLVMIFDPISVYWQANSYPGFFEDIGAHPFQFWLLNSTAGWGNSIFNTVFWILPMLTTGMFYYNEKRSSVAMLLMTRKSKLSYLTSKLITTFVVTLLFYLLLLFINVGITFTIFSSDAPLTEQYLFMVPMEGTFASSLYQRSPLCMALVYCLLNAFALAIFAVLYMAIHMMFKFKNQYVAIAVPIILVYSVTFILDASVTMWHYNIRFILQTATTWAISEVLTWKDLILTFAGWIGIDFILVAVGFIRNRDIV